MNSFWKKITTLLYGILLVGTVYGQATNPAPLEDVINSIRNNRVQEIGRYFDNFVPITINNSPSNYSHNQAELVLRDFFDKNPPRDLVVTDRGTPGNNSMFAIANFKSLNGKYNLYILMKLKDKTYIIKEIRLNKE